MKAGREEGSREARTPLTVAGTLAENILLEYTQGMPLQDVAWGCADGARVRRLIALHTAAFDLRQRDPENATLQASNLLDHIRRAMEQAITGKTDAEAPSRVGDRALFLIGHDTNLANVAGALHLHWNADGRRDDTPPGSALIFELWRSRSTGRAFVRVWYSAQTLEQMRDVVPLTAANPPERVPLRLACGSGEDACSWDDFEKLLQQAIDPRDVIVPEPRRRAGE